MKILFRLILLAFVVSLGFSVKGALGSVAAASVVAVSPSQAEDEPRVVAGLSSVEEDDDEGVGLEAAPSSGTESTSFDPEAVVHRPRGGLSASQGDRDLPFRPPRTRA